MSRAARTVYLRGVALVNAGVDTCSACERRAVAHSIGGHLVCARHAGMAASLADELAQERALSEERRRAQNEADLARLRAKMVAPETVKGDRQRGRNGGKARRSAGDGPDRSERDRAWYEKNRDKKIAQVKARQAVLRDGAA